MSAPKTALDRPSLGHLSKGHKLTPEERPYFEKAIADGVERARIRWSWCRVALARRGHEAGCHCSLCERDNYLMVWEPDRDNDYFMLSGEPDRVTEHFRPVLRPRRDWPRAATLALVPNAFETTWGSVLPARLLAEWQAYWKGIAASRHPERKWDADDRTQQEQAGDGLRCVPGGQIVPSLPARRVRHLDYQGAPSPKRHPKNRRPGRYEPDVIGKFPAFQEEVRRISYTAVLQSQADAPILTDAERNRARIKAEVDSYIELYDEGKPVVVERPMLMQNVLDAYAKQTGRTTHAVSKVLASAAKKGSRSNDPDHHQAALYALCSELGRPGVIEKAYRKIAGDAAYEKNYLASIARRRFIDTYRQERAAEKAEVRALDKVATEAALKGEPISESAVCDADTVGQAELDEEVIAEEAAIEALEDNFSQVEHDEATAGTPASDTEWTADGADEAQAKSALMSKHRRIEAADGYHSRNTRRRRRKPSVAIRADYVPQRDRILKDGKRPDTDYRIVEWIKQGWTQAQMAEELRISQPAVSKRVERLRAEGAIKP